MKNNIYIVAIDGPAGSGKSTTASGVAKSLGVVHLNTGSMYRSVTYKALKQNIAPDNVKELEKIAQNISIEFNLSDDGEQHIIIDGKDLTNEIRSVEISNKVSDYAALAEVRKSMVSLQREIAKKGSLVLEGRDIGTVVFPNADFKFFITASVIERAKRRVKEYSNLGKQVDLQEVIADIEERDYKDTTRKVSPLKQADDAIEVDTTGMTINEQIEFIVNHINK